MRGWQQGGAGSKGGLAGHHSPLPLARSLLQDLVTVIWHLPNRDVLSPIKLIAPQCCKAESQGTPCWGCFRESPQHFPLHPCPGPGLKLSSPSFKGPG